MDERRQGEIGEEDEMARGVEDINKEYSRLDPSIDIDSRVQALEMSLGTIADLLAEIEKNIAELFAEVKTLKLKGNSDRGEAAVGGDVSVGIGRLQQDVNGLRNKMRVHETQVHGVG